MCGKSLHLARHYLDRYLSKAHVHLSQLQLFGATCLLIASKMEDIHPPSVDDFIYISDRTYSTDDFLQAETLILNALDFCLVAPTILDFLPRVGRLFAADLEGLPGRQHIYWLAEYLAELALHSPLPTRFLPSVLAWSCLNMALVAATNTLSSDNDDDERPKGMVTLSVEATNNCIECTKAVRELWIAAPTRRVQATRIKYSRTKFGKVAEIDPVLCLLPKFDKS